MKTKARILTLLLAVITVMSPVMNVAMAATSYGTSTTTDKTVHASSHTVSDDCAKVTKSAKWTNKDKTEAEITIEVDTNYSETQKRATNTDFIYILDKSNSMGDQVSTDWYTVKNALISKLKYFITDDKSGQTYYKDSGNRVAFATFSSHLFTYTKGGENRVAIQYKRYVDEKNEATSGLSALGQVPDAETAKKYFENGVKTAGASNVKFYSTESELNTVIDGVNHHFPGENTNIDLALSYARYLIDNRTGTEKNRKTYVIFITEGQPFPYDDDERNYYGTGKNEDGTYWDWGPARRSDYAANLHHTKIAEAIRDSGAEIYSIMIDRETTHKSDKGLWSSITTGSTTDDSHLFYIPDNERDIAKAIKDIHNKLAAEIETEASKATSMVVTDKIETEYFKFAGTSAATVCETNIGEATINSKTGEVKWDLGDNLEYGVKGSDGKIPKLTIKIKLKDEDSEGWFNTNENLPNDNQCIFEYANTNIKVQTPWLQRIIAKPKYNVTERWVKKTTGEDLETSNKDTVEEGSVYNVIGKKDLTSMGYKYDSSTTNEKTITITKNTEIIHYYTPIENYTVTERWVDKTKEKDLETPNKETLEGNSTYTVIGKKDFSSKGYTYNYSTIDEKTVIVTGNLEIIHYYIPEGIEPDSKIIYGTPTVTKTAKWTNNDKTEAEITITVETDKQKNDETKIKDSDIIYIVDRSKTMGNSKFTYSTIRKSIKNNFKHFITGEFVNANNRVALATFNSWLQIYDDGKINSYEYDYTGGKTGIADYKQSDAENDIFTKLENTGVGKFYNTVTEADNALTAFTSKSEGANTNLDYGLLYAKYLLKNRTGTDKDRKAYVVILTDGDPYPYTKYELEKNAGGRLQDYVANQFIYSLVDELKREYGVEFYVVIVDDDDRSHNEVWEYITSEESGATGNKALKEGSALTTESSFNEIHQEIVESMEENIIYADSAYMNLTDMINTDYFEVISTDSSKTCSTNTGSTSISNNKVYWNLGNVAYGEKCNDGNWPTLKIKIRLKDNNTEGHLNTNYKIPADDQCILTYPDGDVRTPTPWLDRELPDEKATLTVRYVDEATGEEMGKVRETFDKNTYQPSGTTLYRKYSVTGKTNIIATFGLNYSMHELNTERVEVDGDDKYTTSSMPQTIFMDENKEVVFYYNIKEIEYGEAIARTFLVEKIDGKVQKIRTLKEAETIRLEMNVATKISAPTVSEATYLGNRVTNTRDVMTETALSTLNSDTSAWVKVTNEENPKYVDFVYESNVSSCMLMVRYLNEKGESIKTPYYQRHLVGDEVTFDVPSIITKDGITYDYVSRDDGLPQNSSVIMAGNQFITCRYKSRTVPVTIIFKDKITGEEIASRQTQQINIGDSMNVDYSRVSSMYEFLSRTDGKSSETSPVGPVSGATTVTLYYWIPTPPPTLNFGSPVVSYPSIKAEHSDGSKQIAVVGEEITISIPNRYSDIHTQVETNYPEIEKPAGGWNSEYAEAKYLICSFDVYYNGTLYNKGQEIKLSKDTETVKLLIPEWAEEKKGHTIKAIVSSVDASASGGLTYSKAYNTIYDEQAAIGTVTFDLYGKVYDFSVSNLSQDDKWEKSLFENKANPLNPLEAYEPGGAKVNGTTTEKFAENLGSLPIGQKDAQPNKYPYGIAMGSEFTFNINTLGQKNKAISIIPKFVYISRDGEIIDDDIELYYKKGTTEYPELNNAVGLKAKLNDGYQAQRTDLRNEQQKASTMTEYSMVKPNEEYSLGNYDEMTLGLTQRLPYIKYLEELDDTEAYKKTLAMYNSNENKLLNSVCHWYGKFALPNTTVVMESGTPGNGTEYKDGFILVMFRISTKDESGTEYLVYNSQASVDQWGEENGAMNNSQMEIILPSVMGQATTETEAILENIQNEYYPVAIYQVGVSTKYETSTVQ